MHRSLRRRLDPAAAFAWLAQRVSKAVHSKESRSLKGQLGERLIRARHFNTGLTVALTVDRPLQQAQEACLLLAATPEAYDDSLYAAEHQLWLLRRYPLSLLVSELDMLLKQQQALAALLTTNSTNSNPMSQSTSGRFA